MHTHMHHHPGTTTGSPRGELRSRCSRTPLGRLPSAVPRSASSRGRIRPCLQPSNNQHSRRARPTLPAPPLLLFITVYFPPLLAASPLQAQNAPSWGVRQEIQGLRMKSWVLWKKELKFTFLLFICRHTGPPQNKPHLNDLLDDF